MAGPKFGEPECRSNMDAQGSVYDDHPFSTSHVNEEAICLGPEPIRRTGSGPRMSASSPRSAPEEWIVATCPSPERTFLGDTPVGETSGRPWATSLGRQPTERPPRLAAPACFVRQPPITMGSSTAIASCGAPAPYFAALGKLDFDASSSCWAGQESERGGRGRDKGFADTAARLTPENRKGLWKQKPRRRGLCVCVDRPKAYRRAS